MTNLRKYYLFLLCVLSTLLVACMSTKDDGNPFLGDNAVPNVQRLIIRGQVTDAATLEGLADIRVSIAGMDDTTALGYNYAFTDSTGHYTISRYLGRAIPDSVVLIASDTTGVYESKQQKMVCGEHYSPGDIKQNGLYLTADFELKKK